MSKQYQSTHKSVKVKTHDFDLDLILPSGDVINLSFRPESNTMDIVFPRDVIVFNWKGSEMRPAPQLDSSRPHARRGVDQLCVSLMNDALEKSKKEKK